MAAIPPATAPPVSPPFPAFPLPRTNEADFNHVLEHVTNLLTVARRLKITATAGVTTADDLLYIDEDSLLGSVNASTTVMSKMKLKALKRWTEEQETLGKEIDIRGFTLNVCRKIQRELSKSSRSKRDEERQSGKARLSKFDGKAQHWDQCKGLWWRT